jgi:hypothetical protein
MGVGARMMEEQQNRPAAVGTCYGFEVVSSLEFEYLRGGTGDRLRIDEATTGRPVRSGGVILKTWRAVPGQRAETRLLTDERTFLVEIGSDHWFGVDPDALRIEVSPTSDPRLREILLWTTPAAVSVTARGDLALHASAVEIGGRAVLVSAPSGHGKTTTAAAFFAAGYRMLTDDFSCCRVGEQPAVLPGPALLRVHQDVAARLGLERLGLRDVWRTRAENSKRHMVLPPRARGDGGPVPLSAVVFLREATGGIDLERADQADALRDLWSLSFHLPGAAHEKRCFQALADLVARVPVWNLARELDWLSLPNVIERIANEVTKR